MFLTMNGSSIPIAALLLLQLQYLCSNGTNAQDIINTAAQSTKTNTDIIHRKLQRTERERPLAGGFQHVEDIDEQPMIQEAASFALGEMIETEPYGFGVQATQVTVIDAWQQVVQGLNFQLMLGFEDENDECVGACSVLIYNQFGTLSITQWNKEISCEEAKELLEESEGDEV